MNLAYRVQKGQSIKVRLQSWDGSEFKSGFVEHILYQVDEDTIAELVVSVDGFLHTVQPYDIKINMRRDRSRSRDRDEWQQRPAYSDNKLNYHNR